jgi:photosystem II stability/assembly factor-like uncharacterized protein
MNTRDWHLASNRPDMAGGRRAMGDFYIYAGLAGDTDAGRFLSSGMYRCRNGDGKWESIGQNICPAPQARAILADPRRPGRITIGLQDGIWRSDDHGESWRKLAAPLPGLAVWSLYRHPRDLDTTFAGYEPCAIIRSSDDGSSWEKLPVEVTFPDITMSPEPMPKRVLGIAVDPANPDEIYACLEVGGLIRSLDRGRTWSSVIDGVYVNEGPVDLHSVVISPIRPGVVTIATRIGCFRSVDRGDHWRNLAVPQLRPHGSYCRALAYAPGEPNTLFLGGGNDFDGDRGALFVSIDDAATWRILDLGAPLKTTVFAVAVDPAQPDHIFCASKVGQVFISTDRGKQWRTNPLPAGVGHVFSLAVG